MKTLRQLSILSLLIPLNCIFIGTLVSSSALAQTVYKSTDKKTTIYSDKPPKSGEAKEISIDPNQNVIPSEKSAETQALEQQQKSDWENSRAQEQAEANSRKERVAKAEAELSAAEAALAAGQQTQPGDFKGQRPSVQRNERINGLMDAVEQAKENLENAKYSREP